jgi:hypothetical protein
MNYLSPGRRILRTLQVHLGTLCNDTANDRVREAVFGLHDRTYAVLKAHEIGRDGDQWLSLSPKTLRCDVASVHPEGVEISDDSVCNILRRCVRSQFIEARGERAVRGERDLSADGRRPNGQPYPGLL